jgi:hypothetical protein
MEAHESGRVIMALGHEMLRATVTVERVLEGCQEMVIYLMHI